MINRINITIYDFFNGIYSRIPLCCVLFFCKRVLLKGELTIGQNVNNERNVSIDSKSPHYVQCDKCYENNIVANVNFKNGSILKWIPFDRMKLK